MFTKEELLGKKKQEIIHIAKELNAQRYEHKRLLNKDEIISNILEVQQNGTDIKKDVKVSDKSTEKVEQPVKVSKVVSEAKKLKPKKSVLTDEERAVNKLGYIEGAKIGTLVAFKTDTGTVKSAMIVKRSTKKRKFKLETKYGAQFIVSFDDILWVRTNKRWPKGVYQLLKGISEEEVDADAKGTKKVHN